MAEQLFRGKVALITGAAAGIGFATAKAFAEAGAAVALLDSNEAGVMKSAKDLKADGRQALGLSCNIAEEQQVNACIEFTIATFGRLDLACNNADIHVPAAETADATGKISTSPCRSIFGAYGIV